MVRVCAGAAVRVAAAFAGAVGSGPGLKPKNEQPRLVTSNNYKRIIRYLFIFPHQGCRLHDEKGIYAAPSALYSIKRWPDCARAKEHPECAGIFKTARLIPLAGLRIYQPGVRVQVIWFFPAAGPAAGALW